MSTPGWYPDPGGASGQYRYWDGSTWSQGTSSNPDGAPAGQDPGKRPTALIIGAVAVLAAIALVAFFLVPQFLAPGGTDPDQPVDSSSPTVSSWDETSKPTTPPPTGPSSTPSSPQPSGGTQVLCPTGNPNSRQSADRSGLIVGGGLTAAKIPRWDTDVMGIPFAYDVQSQSYTIEAGWFNDIAVGALRMADGFDAPQQAAEMVMQCFASSDFYSGFASRKDLSSKAVTIDGKPGWLLRSEVRVTGRRGIEGDVVEVIVIDPQKGENLAFFQSSATIGRQDIQKLVDAAAASVRLA